MRRFNLVNLTIVTTVFAGAFALTHGIAAASPSDYRAGMAGLLPEAAAWVAEAEMTTGAALAKPEIACSAPMAELGRRGGWIVDDLNGTGKLAPRALAGAHANLTASVARMTVAVESACGDHLTAAQVVQSTKPVYRNANFKLNNFVNRVFGNGR